MYKKYISILIILFVLFKGFNLFMLIINDYKIKHNENTLVLPIEKTKNSISYKFGNNIISFDLNNFSEFNQQRKLDVYLLGYSFNYSLETGTKNYNLEKNREYILCII